MISLGSCWPGGVWALIVFGVITGENSGYFSGRVIALFATGIVAGALFVLAERRSRAPMLDLGYLRKPSFSGSLTVAFATYFGVFSIFFLTALYLQVVIGYTAYRTATLFVPMAVAMIVASTFAGRWVAHSGPRLPVAVGCLAAGAGVLLTDVVLMRGTSFVPLVLSYGPGWAGLRHRCRAHHVGGALGGAGQTFGHGGLCHHDQSGGRDRRGGSRPWLAL